MDAFQATKLRPSVTTFGSGEPIVILGGGPGISSRVYRTFLAPLFNTYTCHFWDCRGTGELSHLAGPYSFKQDLIDLGQVVRELRMRGSYSVLAHSYGGALALAHVLQTEAPIKNLILIGTAANLMDAAKDSLSRKVLRVGDVQLKIAMESLARALSTPENQKELKTFCEIEAKSQLSTHAETLISGFLAFLELSPQVLVGNTDWQMFDFTPRLSKIKARTLVVHGTDDIIIPPEFSLAINNNLPKSARIELDGCGHWPFVECGDGFFRATLDWLKQS